MKIGHHAEKPVPPPTGASTPAPATSAADVAATAATTAAAAAAPSAAASAPAIPVKADDSAKIELSTTASSLLSSSSPEFDAAKVASISKSIEDGTFKINPDVIADKLISNAQELLTKFKP